MASENNSLLSAEIGKDPFNMIAYRLTGSDPHTMRMHFLDGYELIQCWCDNGFVLIEDHVYPMKRGAVYFIRDIDSHCTCPFDASEYMRSKITFSPNILLGLVSQMNEPALLSFFTAAPVTDRQFFELPDSIAEQADSIFREITEEYQKKESGYTAVIWGNILRILSLLARTQTESGAPQEYCPQISDIMEYVYGHLCDFDLNVMCRELHIGKSYACHLFKRNTGMTIGGYLLYRRISAAKKYLLFSKESVFEIGCLCGFSSTPLFSRTFKKHTGLSPLQFRSRFASLRDRVTPSEKDRQP